MPVSLYDATIATFIQIIGGVEGFLARGLDHCGENGIDPEDIVATRLHQDMLPFRFQVNSVVHHSLGAVAAVRAGSFSPNPGPELNYAGLQKQLSDARAELERVSREEVEGFVGKDCVFKFGEHALPFTAENFLLSFSVPNFFFHATTAYDILRQKGVPLGKRDFIGRLRMKR